MAEVSVQSLFDRYLANSDDVAEIMKDAALELSGKDVKALKDKIKKADKERPESKGELGAADPAQTTTVERDQEKERKVVELFWAELEKLDPVSLISEEVTEAFKYIGFNPDVVIQELLFRGKKAGKNKDTIVSDLVNIVTIAIIKGSVTEGNLKKTSDKGKVLYKALQNSYDLVTGGSRGKDSTHLTVARVAASVPGIVIQVLIKKPGFAKTFIGPFGSKALPSYLRHQSAAACIPEGSSEKLKDFLIGLITAFTADQSKALSKTKETPEELFDKQLNFVMTTFSSAHPTEENRKKIFQNFSLANDFDKLSIVAAKVKKVKTDFITLTLQELEEELKK